MKAIIRILAFTLMIGLITCCRQHTLSVCGAITGPFDMKVNVTEFSYNLVSNDLKIEGEMLDSLDVVLLVGVKVLVTTKDSKEVISTMTDVEGKFKLNIKYNPDYLIEFSYIPYKQQTYRLK
ncbi:MAG TPA: hypothetical protein VIY47_15740, partial [Ignavibacteriaceae bacterium]